MTVEGTIAFKLIPKSLGGKAGANGRLVAQRLAWMARETRSNLLKYRL